MLTLFSYRMLPNYNINHAMPDCIEFDISGDKNILECCISLTIRGCKRQLLSQQACGLPL